MRISAWRAIWAAECARRDPLDAGAVLLLSFYWSRVPDRKVNANTADRERFCTSGGER